MGTNPVDFELTGLTTDSRQIKPGNLFIAYRGVNLDLHCFIPDAIKRGAAAIIAEQEPTDSLPSLPFIIVPQGREALAYLAALWHNFPARQLSMVGLTGTDGKTTTTHFLYHILRAAGKKVGMINSVSALIGDETLETGLHTTTPDAPDVQRFLAQMVVAETEVCLLETTSHGLAQHRVTACDFDVAIVTNITHEHLDVHGSLADYRAAKASLFESLATAAPKGQPKLAVLNCDDWSFEYLKEKLERNHTTWRGYSLVAGHPQATLSAEEVTYHPDKTRFTLRWGAETFAVETNLVGDYNVSNCLAAATAALEVFQLPPAVVQQGAAALRGIPGRMERLDEGQDFLAVVDFAHTPNALRRSLSVAKTLTPGRVIAVFGCAGLRDVEKRVMMGHIAAELADVTLITAEDPRTENLADIIAATANTMLADGAIEGLTFERVPDRGRALYLATQLARPGDMVIALGKGHEQSMCFGEIEYPWDDRQALRTALRGAPLLTLPTAS
jgi:UDP-N-acetylmuramoyl-L-alanyl-D-glutamate--2,6-diaminopimelate ligase